MISVIIPIYNEQDMLLKNSSYFNNLSKHAELIFADGGSADRSVELAESYSKVLHCGKCRAVQMNAGALAAVNDTLLFLHVDTFISIDTLASIEKKVAQNGYVGGCLTQRIDRETFIFRLIEAQGNIRARISKVFYGDQGIFVRKDIFLKMGGFPKVPILEDALFTKKLRKWGKTAILPDKIIVSPRRWKKKGIVKTTLLYNFIIILFRLGYPLEKIKLLYDDLR